MRVFFYGLRLFGLRTGVSLGKEDLRWLQRKMTSDTKAGAIEGQFLYVISNGSGQVKVGVTQDPITRLSALQTGTHQPLRLIWTGGVSKNGTLIERAAHSALGNYHAAGEWFTCSVDIAIAALSTAAHFIGEPMVPIAPADVARVLEIARATSVNKSGKWERIFTQAFVLAAGIAITYFEIDIGFAEPALIISINAIVGLAFIWLLGVI